MRTAILIVAILLGIAASRTVDVVPIKRQLEVTVIDLHDIPQTCFKGLFRRDRTNPPAEPMLGFCGAIYTDLGLFAVRESSRIPSLFTNREEIIAGLKEGCRYRIWVNLLGRMPNPEARLSNHVPKKIYRAELVDTCNTAGTGS